MGVMSSSPSEDGISYIENGEENKDNFKEWNLDMETLEKDKQHLGNKPLKLLRFLNMSPQPQPSLIKVAPAIDVISNLESLSNETLDNPYRRSRDFDAYEVSITR